MEKNNIQAFSEYLTIESLKKSLKRNKDATPKELLDNALADLKSTAKSKNSILMDFATIFDIEKTVDLEDEDSVRNTVDSLNQLASAFIPARIKIAEQFYSIPLESTITEKKYSNEELLKLSGLPMDFETAKKSIGEGFESWLQQFTPKSKSKEKVSLTEIRNKNIQLIRNQYPNLFPAEYSVYTKKAEELAKKPVVGYNWHWSKNLKTFFVMDLLNFAKYYKIEAALGIDDISEEFSIHVANDYKNNHEVVIESAE